MFRYLVTVTAIFALMAWTVPQASAVTPVRITQDDAAKAQAEFDAIQKNFQAAVEELRELVAQAETKDEKVQLLGSKNPILTYGDHFMEMAKAHKGTKASLNATLFVVGQSKGDQKNEAMNFLLANYPDKVKLSKVASSFKEEVPHPDMEGWFDLMVDNADSDKTKASILLSYSQFVGQIAFFKRSIELNPHIGERLPDNQLAYINAERTDAQKKKHEARLETLISDFGDLKYQGRKTYGQVAKSELFELTRLQVGMVAPDIEGNDLDDIPFKLSHYRGKVVMLDFWGHWCPPCRAMYGHEQEISKTLADKPFVLLGVNSDGKKEVAIDAVRDESLSWRHFWNGPTGTRGPISTTWNVEGWPTVYLIDEKGVIRYKEVLGKDIDRGIEVLMAEMGHEVNFGDAE